MIKGSDAEGAGREQSARMRGLRSAARRASRRVRGFAHGTTGETEPRDEDGGYDPLEAPRKRARREDGDEDDDNIVDRSPGGATYASADPGDEGGPEGGGRLERRRRQLREASRRFRQKQRDTISTLNEEVADMRRVVFVLTQELERHSIPIPSAAKSAVSRELVRHAATNQLMRVFAHASSSSADTAAGDNTSRASGSSAAHADAAHHLHSGLSPTADGRGARQSQSRSSRSSVSASRAALERVPYAPHAAHCHHQGASHHHHAANRHAQAVSSAARDAPSAHPQVQFAVPTPSRPEHAQPCVRPWLMQTGHGMPGANARALTDAPAQAPMPYPQGAMQYMGMPYPGYWGMPPALPGFGQSQAAAAAAVGDGRVPMAPAGAPPLMYPRQMGAYWGMEQHAGAQEEAGMAQRPPGVSVPTTSPSLPADSYSLSPALVGMGGPDGSVGAKGGAQGGDGGAVVDPRRAGTLG